MQTNNKALNDFITEYETDFFHQEPPGTWDSNTRKFTPKEFEGWAWKLVDHYGGEGQGEIYWTVYEFSRGDENYLVKFDGWYQSYDGSTFTEWFVVTPKEKMVTVFEKI